VRDSEIILGKLFENQSEHDAEINTEDEEKRK
jgi:hypothetical protein